MKPLTNESFTRGRVLAACAALAGLVCTLYFATRYEALRLDLAYAVGQVRVFDGVTTSCQTETDPHKIAESLQYVVNYYPSGARQRKGSSLDAIVESSRSAAVRAIIARLRATTGADEGASPEPWIKRYVR
jgi:hypothetical protein